MGGLFDIYEQAFSNGYFNRGLKLSANQQLTFRARILSRTTRTSLDVRGSVLPRSVVGPRSSASPPLVVRAVLRLLPH